MNKITNINLILKDFFEVNFSVKKVHAKDMMPYFVLAGIFKQDEKNGVPIINFLRNLDKKKQLSWIPFAMAEQKSVYVKWYFENKNVSTTKIMNIQDKIVNTKSKKSKSSKKNATLKNTNPPEGRLF